MISATSAIRIIAFALDREPDPKAAMPQRHFCNAAIHDVLEPDSLLIPLAYSYEDNDVDECEDASSMANAIEAIAPDKFILITTGDYIMSRHSIQGEETYDPHYHYYLMPAKRFAEHREALEAADTEWRDAAEARANPYR